MSHGRHEWIDAVMRSDLPGPARAVCHVLYHAMNSKTGRCFPSVDTISRKSGFGRTAVIGALKLLKSSGWVEIRGGGGTVNRYRLTTPNQSASRTAKQKDSEPNQSAKQTSPPKEPVRETDGTSPPSDPDQSASRTLTTKEPPKNHQEEESDPRFLSWYIDYPNKKARAAAEKAFAKLRPDDKLLALMRRKLAEQIAWRERMEAAGQDPPFWSHPATWINGKRWNDEFEEPKPRQRHGKSNGGDRLAQSLVDTVGRPAGGGPGRDDGSIVGGDGKQLPTVGTGLRIAGR